MNTRHKKTATKQRNRSEITDYMDYLQRRLKMLEEQNLELDIKMINAEIEMLNSILKEDNIAAKKNL